MLPMSTIKSTVFTTPKLAIVQICREPIMVGRVTPLAVLAPVAAGARRACNRNVQACRDVVPAAARKISALGFLVQVQNMGNTIGSEHR